MSNQVQRRFQATPAAVRDARAFLRSAFAGRVDPEALSDLTLVLSELATNAVRHARSPFEVVVSQTDAHVRIEIHDGSAEAPELKAPSDEGGRGLGVVEQLCDRWGVQIERDTKCVWCERDLPDVSG